jgi:hypothetical protein
MQAFTESGEGFNEKVSRGTLFFVFLPPYSQIKT